MEAGYSPFQSKVIANRMRDIPAEEMRAHVAPSLQQLDPPYLLPDIGKAAARIAEAVIGGQHLVLVSDHDADGADGHAVAKAALIEVMGVPEERVHSYLSHRLKEGYGVSDALTDRMLGELESVPKPALAITIDQGSTDQARIHRLLEQGIETVVTDHHGIPEEGIPSSAVACVNPVRADSEFPDKQIAGCHVIWLVMCAVRKLLIDMGHIQAESASMAQYLDWVATGTAADCVGLSASRNNRAVMRYGLWLMNTRPRPCWSAIREVARLDNGLLSAIDVAFMIASRINASGRIDDARLSLDLLMEKDHTRALDLATQLEQANKERKAIQRELTAAGLEIGAEQDKRQESAIVVFFENGHTGVHGVAASRLVEAFGRPVACFSPKQGSSELISGSFRSIEGVHMRAALARAAELEPGCITTFGGHAGAAGAVVPGFELIRFTTAFRAAVSEQKSAESMRPVVFTDGPLETPCTLNHIQELGELEPYGREFDPPTFDGYFRVLTMKAMGDGTHLMFTAENKLGHTFDFVWFNAKVDPADSNPLNLADQVRIAFTIRANTFRGTTRVQHLVKYVEPFQEDVAA